MKPDRPSCRSYSTAPHGTGRTIPAIITTPLQKAQGILTNLETFEQQARLTATQGKDDRNRNDKKTKEAREKQERWKKLLKRAEEAFTAGKYSEATTCLRQPRYSQIRTGRNR